MHNALWNVHSVLSPSRNCAVNIPCVIKEPFEGESGGGVQTGVVGPVGAEAPPGASAGHITLNAAWRYKRPSALAAQAPVASH